MIVRLSLPPAVHIHLDRLAGGSIMFHIGCASSLLIDISLNVLMINIYRFADVSASCTLCSSLRAILGSKVEKA